MAAVGDAAQGHAMKSHRGYILLYVLAVMVVLSSIALGIAYRERIGFKLVLNRQDGLRREAALQGGLVYTVAQLDQSAQLAGLFDTNDPKVKGIDRWTAGKTFTIPLGEQSMSVALRQSQPPVDFNLLTDKALGQLFVALGADNETAAQLTVQLLAAKPEKGFESKEAVLASVNLPNALLQRPQGSNQPLFADLIELGSHLAMIDLDRTPLPLVSALSDIPMAQLAPLAELRRKGPVTRDAAIALLGDKFKTALPDAGAMTAIIAMEGEPGWLEAQLQLSKQQWQVGRTEYHLFETPPATPAASTDTVEASDNE